MSGWAALGGVVDGLFNLGTSAMSNAFNRREAKANRDYQTIMSNTAVRRHTRDLKAAGWNPILAATGGKTASTPPGAQARAVQPPSITPIASAMSLKKASEEVKNLGLTGEQIAATSKYLAQQTATSAAQQALIEQNMVIRGHEEHMAKLLGEVAQGPGREILGILKSTGTGPVLGGGLVGLAGYILNKMRASGQTTVPYAPNQGPDTDPKKRPDVRKQPLTTTKRRRRR